MLESLSFLKTQRDKTVFSCFTPVLELLNHLMMDIQKGASQIRQAVEPIFEFLHKAYLLEWLFRLIFNRTLLYQF